MLSGVLTFFIARPKGDLGKVFLNARHLHFSDGLHLGRQGSATLVSLLVPEMHNKLSTNPESPLLMPLWRDLDNADVAKSYSHWKST